MASATRKEPQDLESCRHGDGHELDASVILEEDPGEEPRQFDLEADRPAELITRTERGASGSISAPRRPAGPAAA
jgi:hypothetical protein